jgi:hypothetical protein
MAEHASGFSLLLIDIGGRAEVHHHRPSNASSNKMNILTKLMYRGYYLLDAFTQKDHEEEISVV